MIVVKLQGGLGNQLFQYAAGRALSLRLGVDLALDKSWFYKISRNNTPRNFDLDKYNINVVSLTPYELYLNRIRSYTLGRSLSFLFSSYDLFYEREFDFNQQFNSLKDGTFLIGYWQSYLYFEGFSNKIRDELTLLEDASVLDEGLIGEMREVDSVSIHIRRGDYISNLNAANFHGICSTGYYQSAVEIIARKVANPKLFIFSDDIEWVRNNIQFGYPTQYIDHHVNSPWFDLNLMSNCKHHIVANSSFSWWGAWLSDFKDKTVIAPAKWFAGRNIQPKTLLPKPWVKLEI